MGRERSRDVEAISAATEIADSIVASPEARSTGILIGARAYRRGEKTGAFRSDNHVKSLEAEVAELRARLAEAESAALFTPAECRYAATLRDYGMTLGEIGKVLGVSAKDVREAIKLHKSKGVRFASDRNR